VVERDSSSDTDEGGCRGVNGTVRVNFDCGNGVGGGIGMVSDGVQRGLFEL
jgi:hypothetical protein